MIEADGGHIKALPGDRRITCCSSGRSGKSGASGLLGLARKHGSSFYLMFYREG
jgi:hypothetical protein